VIQESTALPRLKAGLFFGNFQAWTSCLNLEHIRLRSEPGVQCPSCQNTDSRVLESRAADGGRSVRRRRECLNCEFRFTTYERVETMPITVLKRNGNRESFSRSKLLHGLSRACEKTGITATKLEEIVDELELTLQQRNGREVTSHDIGELVLEQLKELSEVAYVRFASVYKQFRGVNDFVKTLEGMNTSKPPLATV
jgi:transcriptional repressor NrdR